MNDVKVGDTCEFVAGGQKLILEPIPYGRLKRVLKFVMEAISDIAKSKDMDKEEIGKIMPEMLMEHAAKIVPLLFDASKHPFLTPEWLEDNLTIPLAKDIIKKAVVINDLSDFFGKMGVQATGMPQSETEIRPLVETPKT